MVLKEYVFCNTYLKGKEKRDWSDPHPPSSSSSSSSSFPYSCSWELSSLNPDFALIRYLGAQKVLFIVEDVFHPLHQLPIRCQPLIGPHLA